VSVVGPILVAMVVEGAHDVEAAEMLGVLYRDDERASWIVNALTDGLATPSAETAVRLRMFQAQ
jgi:transcriptional regulator